METNKSGLVTGLGIGGLVLGILALIVSFIPCFGIYALFIGVLAIIVSVVGIIFAVQKKVGKGLLIAAIVVALLGSAIAFWQYQKIKSLGEDVVKQMQEATEQVGDELETPAE